MIVVAKAEIGAALVFTYAAALRAKVVPFVMDDTEALAGKMFPASAVPVAADAAFAVIVNCVAESMVRMRVLAGMMVPVLVTNMPTLRFVVVVAVTMGLAAEVVPVT